MTETRFEKLTKVGFVWDAQEASWEMNYNALVAYKEECGHCFVPNSFVDQSLNLGIWVNNQRVQYKSSEMTETRFEKLTKVGFGWEVKSGRKKKGKSRKG